MSIETVLCLACCAVCLVMTVINVKLYTEWVKYGILKK